MNAIYFAMNLYISAFKNWAQSKMINILGLASLYYEELNVLQDKVLEGPYYHARDAVVG